MSDSEQQGMTAAEWHAYISSAPNFAAAQDRMEEAQAAGVDWAEMRGEQQHTRQCVDCGAVLTYTTGNEPQEPCCAACVSARSLPDSPAVADAKSRARDTDYTREYGEDETLWTHFLRWQDATAADWDVALSLVTRVIPEATGHIDHLRLMRDLSREQEALADDDPTLRELARVMVRDMRSRGESLDARSLVQCDASLLPASQQESLRRHVAREIAEQRPGATIITVPTGPDTTAHVVVSVERSGGRPTIVLSSDDADLEGVAPGRYDVVPHPSAPTPEPLYPAALLDYAEARGYSGAPLIAAVYAAPARTYGDHGGWTTVSAGVDATVETVLDYRSRGFTAIAIEWPDSDARVRADFQVSELVPQTGLRGCGSDAPRSLSILGLAPLAAAHSGHSVWLMLAFVAGVIIMVVGGYYATRSSRPERRATIDGQLSVIAMGGRVYEDYADCPSAPAAVWEVGGRRS